MIPKIGRKPGSELTRHDLHAVLKPIWRTKYPTALKAWRRTRIVLTSAKKMGYPVDPVIAEEALEMLGEVDHRPTHIAAADWRHMPRIWAGLGEGQGAACCRWIMLTLVRMEAARGARVSEIDFDEKVWTVPADRIKGRKNKAREFRVPLPGICLEMARARQEIGLDLMFFGRRADRPITNVAVEKALKAARLPDLNPPIERGTPHGFRTSFRTWVQDTEACSWEVAETVLGHVIGGTVERAYARSDLLEQRRRVMEDWVRFVTSRDGLAPSD